MAAKPAKDPAAGHGAEDRQRQLDATRVDSAGTSVITTNQCVRVDHPDDSLTVGACGPTLLEDFHAREKITYFDHTFRFVNREGRGTFVKCHWTPVLGVHSLEWDECQKIQGKDPDFQPPRPLGGYRGWCAYPEYELGVQLVAEPDEHAFDVISTPVTNAVPQEFVDAFCAALAHHRFWQRDTAAVPA